MIYSDIINKVSEEINLPKEVVDKTYKGFWKWVNYYISNLPLKESQTEEEFNKIRTSINIPSLGKLYSSYDKLEKLRRKYNYYKSLKNDYSKED